MPINLGLKDFSGTIAVGGTQQQVLTQNFGRAYLLIQNIDPSEDLWISFVGNAAVNTAGSVRLAPFQMLLYETDGLIPTNALSVVAATGGHKFTVYQG